MPKPAPQLATRTTFTDCTYIFTEGGTVEGIYAIRETEALADDISLVQVSHSYFSDPRPDIITFHPYTDCRLIATNISPIGMIIADLELPAPLSRGPKETIFVQG